MHNKTFLGVDTIYEKADIIINSIPYDGTASYKSGSKFAPDSIREHSLIGYETYSPKVDKDLDNLNICDLGNMEISYTDPGIVMDEITDFYNSLDLNKKIATIGGEHSITYGIIKSLIQKYDDLVIIQIDAHTDLREEYLGSRYSHASVMKRISELIGMENLYQLGIRSGTKEEFNSSKNIYKYDLEALDTVLKMCKNKHVYLTLDLDVLDPGYFPGTGTPESDGITSKELFDAIYKLNKINNNIVGFDMVELAPHYDPSYISTGLAIKVFRELLLSLG